jgi:hypothetical protein
MRSAFARRFRRSPSATREPAQSRKDNQQEPAFFSAPSAQPFFSPAAVQRKCAGCEAEEKSVKRMNASPEEEKKLHRMSAPEEEKKVARSPEEKKEEHVQRTADKQEEDKSVHRKADAREEKTVSRQEAGHAAAPAAYIHSLDGKGSALPDSTQQFFAEKMGADFSGVKIHTGHDAEHSAREVNAKAYTVDKHIVFNSGQFNPDSADGRRLLAHELTHVMQNGEATELQRKVLDPEKDQETGITLTGTATRARDKKAFGSCEGVSVEGLTEFTPLPSSFKVQATKKTATDCDECTAPDCIVATGTVISTFRSTITVTLPPVPDGLSACETAAVRRFINTTLRNHEQQHVAAFKTYNGTVRTPFTYTGCKSGLQDYVQSIHEGLDSSRSASAIAASDALDPFVRAIPCNCD